MSKKSYFQMDDAEKLEFAKRETTRALARTLNIDTEKLKELKLDAAQSVFFEGELKNVAKVVETIYAPLEWSKILGVRPIAPGNLKAGYRIFDGVGSAELISDYTKGGPRADVKGTEETYSLYSFGASFGYSDEELEAANLTGVALDSMRMTRAKRALDEKMNTKLLLGDTELGINGAFKMASVSITAATAAFASTTADNICNDLFAIIDKVNTQSKGAFNTNVLVMDRATHAIVSSKQRSSGSDKTCLQFVMENRPGVEIVLSDLIATASASDSRRMMALEKSPASGIEAAVSELFKMLPPEREAYGVGVNCKNRFGSVEMPFRVAAAYMDGH